MVYWQGAAEPFRAWAIDTKAMEVTKALRYRINISRGMTGKYSFEATVEMEGETMEDILSRSDELVKALEYRYPPEEPKKPVLSKAEGPIEKPSKTAGDGGMGKSLGESATSEAPQS